MLIGVSEKIKAGNPTKNWRFPAGAGGRDIELLESDFNLGFGYFLILYGLKLGSVAITEILSKI